MRVSEEMRLDRRWAPVLIGAVTAALLFIVAGTLQRIPVVHDEAAYLLQARLFASGHWTAPGRPVPEFFEQLMIFVTPFVASKYPPGQSLMLVPGVWLGVPGLVPILFAGVSGALVFAMARRVAGGWVAVLTWLLWISSYPTLYWRATYYMSETTSDTAWLVAWWGLLVWRVDQRRWGLIVTALAVGVVTITRPLTGVALALPVGVVALETAWRRHEWLILTTAAAVGAAVLMVIPMWSAATTGDWRQTPLRLHERMYLPNDHPGFGDGVLRQPERRLPPDLAANQAAYTPLHLNYRPSAVPRTLLQRLDRIAHDAWYDWRIVFAPFAALALLVLGVEGWFAVAGAATMILVYLLYAHLPTYTLYYQEIEPVLAFVTAVGLATVAKRVRVLLPVTAATLIVATVLTVRSQVVQVRDDQRYWVAFQSAVAAIPDRKAIVFVHYASGHNNNLALVRTDPDPDTVRVWTAYDRGPDNARLIAVAPDRTPYRFDEATWSLLRLPQRSASVSSSRPAAE